MNSTFLSNILVLDASHLLITHFLYMRVFQGELEHSFLLVYDKSVFSDKYSIVDAPRW